MIVYDVVCVQGHRTEGWFPSAEAFDAQKAAGDVRCPLCGGDADRAPSAARVARGGGGPEAIAEALRALRRAVVDRCDYVGPRFPEEARKIHYGNAEHRDIYGEASEEEAAALLDEGVEVTRLPWIELDD